MIYVNERIQFKCITTFGSKFKNLLKKKTKYAFTIKHLTNI